MSLPAEPAGVRLPPVGNASTCTCGPCCVSRAPEPRRPERGVLPRHRGGPRAGTACSLLSVPAILRLTAPTGPSHAAGSAPPRPPPRPSPPFGPRWGFLPCPRPLRTPWHPGARDSTVPVFPEPRGTPDTGGSCRTAPSAQNRCSLSTSPVIRQVSASRPPPPRGRGRRQTPLHPGALPDPDVRLAREASRSRRAEGGDAGKAPPRLPPPRLPAPPVTGPTTSRSGADRACLGCRQRPSSETRLA